MTEHDEEKETQDRPIVNITDKPPIFTLVESISIRKLEGLDHKTLTNEMLLAHEMTQDQVDDLINEALDLGYIYEPLLGIFKINPNLLMLCPGCNKLARGERDKDGHYTTWKCQSCGWGDVQS